MGNAHSTENTSIPIGALGVCLFINMDLGRSMAPIKTGTKKKKKKITRWGDNHKTIRGLMQVDWIFSKNYKYMLSFALSSRFCFADMIPVKVNGVCFNIRRRIT